MRCGRTRAPRADDAPELLLRGPAGSISSFSTVAVPAPLPLQQCRCHAGQGPGHSPPGCSSTALVQVPDTAKI